MKKNSTSENQSTHRVTPTSLAFQWRKHLELNWHSDDYITAIHLGQLKYFIQSTGNQASEAMNFAIKNWQKFSSKVLKVKNPTYTSWLPDITFMCSHGDILLLCMNGQDSPSVRVTNHSHGVPKPTSPVSEFEPKATKADVIASLALIDEIVKKNKNT